MGTVLTWLSTKLQKNNTVLLDFTSQELFNLNETALWVIMDPWEDQENRINMTPDIDPGIINAFNKPIMDKILVYLPNMKHPIVITDHIKHSPERLKTLFWISHYQKHAGVHTFNNYMLKKKLSKIIFCGFHESNCVINRRLGYNKMSKHYDCYISWELTCPYPVTGWQTIQKNQREMKKYKYVKFE